MPKVPGWAPLSPVPLSHGLTPTGPKAQLERQRYNLIKRIRLLRFMYTRTHTHSRTHTLFFFTNL